jgi:hypothetical protein
MKKIFDLLEEYARNKGLYGNCCYLSEYKTNPCPIKFKPNSNDYYEHMRKCPYYHSNLEKRRINKNSENEICKEAIKDGKWTVNEEEKVNCSKNDYCNKFHTRNELFFDEKNYRKLYPCTDHYYCEKGDLCPKKHPTDIKIEEIYLPLENKNELERRLIKLIEKDEKIKRTIDLFSRVVCKACLNYIDGEHGRNIYFFKSCSHAICSFCYEHYKSCPFCGLNEDNNSENNGRNANELLIIIDEKIKSKKNKKDEKIKKSKRKKSDKESDEDEGSDEKKEEEKEEDDDDSSSDDDYSHNDDDLIDNEGNDVDGNDSDFSMEDIAYLGEGPDISMNDFKFDNSFENKLNS